MAGRSSRHVWGVVIFCVALLFVSGIILPKLLSKHYFEMRPELINKTLTLDFDENYTISTEAAGNGVNDIPRNDSNESSLASKLVQYNGISSVAEPDTSRIPTLKRSKRQVSDENDNEYFAWNFNLNISRHKNPARISSLKSDIDDSKENRLDAAIYMSGNGLNQSYNVQKGLDSAGVFIRSIFGEGVQKLTLEETQKIDEADYLVKGNLQMGSHVQNPVTGETAEVETRSSGPKKRGRFLFELFGFGRTSTVKPGQSDENKIASESPTESSSLAVLSDNETNFSTGKDNFQFSSSQVDFNGSTFDFQTEAPVSESEHVSLRSLSCGNKDKCESPSILNKVTEVTLEIFRNITPKREECGNCELSFSNKGNETLDSFDETAQFSHSFTDERLENFCMDLVHKLGESRIFLTDKDNSKEVGSKREDSLSTPSPVNIGCFNLTGPSEEKSKPVHGIIENAFLVTTDTSSNSLSAKDTERDARIFSWFQFGLGSGRSELDQQIPEESINAFSSSSMVKDAGREARIFDLSELGLGSGRSGLDEEVVENLQSDLNELNTEETEREPTVKDCISYFRKNQNIMMFPKPNLMDIISDENIEIADIANATISPKLKQQQIKFIIDLLESSINNCALEKAGEAVENVQALGKRGKFTHEFSTGEKLLDTDTEVLTRTSVVDFKSKNTRVTMDDETGQETQQTTEMYRNERIWGFGSGDISPETDLRFMSAIKREERLQKHPDRLEVSTEDLATRHSDCAEHTDTECENDSFVANTPVDMHNCNDSACHSEMEILQIPASNGDCLEDCFSFHNDSNISQNNERISYNKTEFNERTLTHLKENALSLSCDGCSSNTEGILDKNAEITESSLKMKSETFSTSQNRGNDCDDCDDRNPPEKEMQESDSVPRKIASTINSRSIESTESARNLKIWEFQAVETGDTDHTKVVENVTELSNILDIDANQNFSKIFGGSVFLSGSGDGSLSGDAEERINITVDNSASPRKLPGRRGRLLDDEIEINHCDECVDLSDALGNQNIPTETVRDDPELVTSAISGTDDGRGLKFSIDPSESSQTVSLKVLNGSFLTEVFSKSIMDYSDVLTTVEPQPRSCVSASQCNGELNERCVTTDSFSSMCSCGRAFVRNRISRKCVQKSSYKTDLKLPAEKFEEDLGDPVTRRYMRKEEDANKLMHYLLMDNPHLIPIMADVTFTGFSPGSLILSWDMVLAAENVSEEKMMSILQKDLNRALHDAGLREKAPFNVSNAYVLSVSSTMDPCMSTELNYCHKNSLCVRNRFLPGGFQCRCKEDYLDVSFNSEYPGEICEALCSSDYCGYHGECIWTPETGRHCICKDWYFGDRCGISGKVVVAGFSANIFMFMILVLVLVICKTRRNRSRSYGRNSRGSTEFGTHAIAAGRVSDVIAMEENIGTRVAKISHISTPVHNVPAIKVVRPTLSESSISLYDDSTFDVTPASESDQRNSERESVN